MPDVKVDYDAMDELVGMLGSLREELDGQKERSRDIADATSHRRLSGAVRDFADGWRVRRSELVEQLDDTRTQASAIRESFLAFDHGTE
ncbi:hypothetical protein [Microbacterium sp. gxy059]|uniref:hypothetical protein n=1 Tax=Microbacterium sp. gxy059 TaxID=2957199 RepID=UPI003D995B4F